MCLLLLTFLYELLLLHPTIFDMLCFHFHLFQDISWFTFWFFLTQKFKIISFDLHVFFNFPIFFLLSTSYFIPLWWKRYLKWLQFFKFIKVCFWLSIQSILKNIPFACENNEYSAAIKWNVLYMYVRYFCYIVYSRLMLFYWFSLWMIYSL